MKTLKDLGEKYYSNIHYSFDVYYYPGYDDMYVGTLKNIMEIKGYRVQFKSPTMEGLVKMADQFLDITENIQKDRESMKDLVYEWNFDNKKELKNQVEIYNDLQEIAGFPENKI